MGEIANQMLENGAKVTGVMPKGLFPEEIVHNRLSRLIEVQDMHERKKNNGRSVRRFYRSAGRNWYI